MSDLEGWPRDFNPFGLEDGADIVRVASMCRPYYHRPTCPWAEPYFDPAIGTYMKTGMKLEQTGDGLAIHATPRLARDC